MSVTAELVFDVTGPKCAELLVSEKLAFVGAGCTCFDRFLGSAASHPSTPPRSEDSAADVQQKKKSCIVSRSFCELGLDLYSQYATSSLIIAGY